MSVYNVYKSLDNKSLLILDNVMYKIINSNTGTKYIGFEVFRNNHDDLQNSKNESLMQGLTEVVDYQ